MISSLLHSKRDKIIIVVFIALILLIPSGSFLISQRLKTTNPPGVDYDRAVTKQSPKEVPKKLPSSKTTAATDKKDNAAEQENGTSGEINRLLESSNSAELSFGPTLNFKIQIEGRPAGNQTGKIFFGLAAGKPQLNPKYILSFLIDIGADGVYKGLNIAGLEGGQQYTAYIKGQSQIATGAAFTLTPAFNDLGTVILLSGDLNEDNVVNTADYAISKAALGTNPSSSNWNADYDINKDGVVNVFDLGFIIRNLSKIGAGGPWISTPATKTATPSASSRTNRPVGSSHCHPSSTVIPAPSTVIPAEAGIQNINGSPTRSGMTNEGNDSNCTPSFGSIGVDFSTLKTTRSQAPLNTKYQAPLIPLSTPLPQISPTPTPNPTPILIPTEGGDWVFLPRN